MNQGFISEPELEPMVNLLEPTRQTAIQLELNRELAVPVTGCVRLDLEDLPCFTVVERQYEQWGVLFSNAIAIHPSNPVFSAYSGVMVLLGAPKSGWLEATFIHPVQYVGGFVTSPHRIIISAFNRHNQLIAQGESLPIPGGSIKGRNIKDGNIKDGNIKDSSMTVRLSLTAANIHRVTLHSFNAQLTLDDFCFCGV
jgi:hypothetical protein